MSNHTEIARRYLEALEQRVPWEQVAAFYDPDVTQHEFPNRLVPQGKKRSLHDLAEASERGRQVLTSQRYEVLSAVEQGDTVAMEFLWTGTLKVALGSLPVGGTLRARCAMFLTFRQGRILTQHNYDGFEPF